MRMESSAVKAPKSADMHAEAKVARYASPLVLHSTRVLDTRALAVLLSTLTRHPPALHYCA